MKIISTTHMFPASKDAPCPDDWTLPVNIAPPEDGARLINITIWRDDDPAYETALPRGVSKFTRVDSKWAVDQKKADEKSEERDTIEQDTALFKKQIAVGMGIPKEYLEPAFSARDIAFVEFEREERKRNKDLLDSAIAKWWLTQTPTAYTIDHTGAPLGAAATHALSIIALLNEALRYDRLAIERLIEHRVPCSDRMLEHPTIQTTDDGLGMLGILNGIVGAIEEGPKKGCGWIAAVYDDDENLTHFRLNLPQSEEK